MNILQTYNKEVLRMEDIKQSIINFYKNYDVNIAIEKVVEAFQVNRYFIKLDRSNKTRITNVEKLVDDLAAELGIKNIKFTTDFETGGIVFEIPKKDRKTLYLKDIEYIDSNQKGLQVCLGKDLNNNNYIINLCDTPHLLVAGTTGSGKSVFINSILINLLNNYKKDYLQISLIDPKKVELSIYKNCEQVKEIANNLAETKQILKNALLDIDYRYRQLETYNCRNIESYNKKAIIPKFPYKVIIIDELADIILQDRQEQTSNRKKTLQEQSLESLICRIAQIGRACGVHLIVATQRPSSDIITGLIKSNIPSRVAFSVSTKIDSRVILDDNGAEKLTGKGDMLFKMVGDEEIHRLQGAYVSDEEIEKAVDENTNKEEIKRQEVEKMAIIQQQKEQEEQQRILKEKAEKERKKQENELKFEAVINNIMQWFLGVIIMLFSSFIWLIGMFFICRPVFWIFILIIIFAIVYTLFDGIKRGLQCEFITYGKTKD